jgi:hypothetical protein
MTTEELLKSVREGEGNVVEAGLRLRHGLRSTHFLQKKSKNRIYDEGCDGERRSVSYEQFLEEYKGAVWNV